MASSKRTSTRARQAPWDHEPPAKTARKKPKTLTPAQKAHAKQRARKAGRPYPNLVDNMHEAASTSATKRPPRKKATTRRGGSTGDATREKTASKKKTSARAGSTSRRASTQRTTTAKKAPARKSATRKTSARKTSARKTSAKKAPARKAPRKKTARKSSGASREKDPHGGLTAAGRAAFARKDGSRLRPGVKKAMSEMTPEEMRRKGSWAVRFYGRAGKLPPLQDESGAPTRFALTAAAWGEPVPKTERAARAIASKGQRLLARARAAKAR